jgi:uridine kinase
MTRMGSPPNAAAEFTHFENLHSVFTLAAEIRSRMKKENHLQTHSGMTRKDDMESRPQIVAIVGGSDSGKSWLTRRMQRLLGAAVTRVSLDDFFLNSSALPRSLRERINLDTPRAVDWRALERLLRAFRDGHSAEVPQFSLAGQSHSSHTREVVPSSIVLVDGPWLLLRPEIRELFDFRIFLDCPAQLRLERRLVRNLSERGRNAETVRRQFWRVVMPMHSRYVSPQSVWADIVMKQPPSEEEVQNLAETIRTLIEPDAPYAEPQFSSREIELLAA